MYSWIIRYKKRKKNLTKVTAISLKFYGANPDIQGPSNSITRY